MYMYLVQYSTIIVLYYMNKLWDCVHVSWLLFSLHLWQADLAQLYIKAGLKNIGTVFLLTDTQIPEEKFLVVINDLLASGEIPDLFDDDQLDQVISGVRNEVKGAGIQDTKENCWSFFIDRVRRQLKVQWIVCSFVASIILSS